MTMTRTKRLTRSGNSVALVLDREILEAAGIDATRPVEISVHGDSIVVTTPRSRTRKQQVESIAEDAHRRYGPVFKKLAE
jgi:antitoxin MazE